MRPNKRTHVLHVDQSRLSAFRIREMLVATMVIELTGNLELLSAAVEDYVVGTIRVI